MAQQSRTTAAKPKPKLGGRPLGRPPGSKNKVKAPPAGKATGRAAKAAPAKPAAPSRKAVTAIVVAKPSKEELRLQVEKLERTVATLRARSREAVRAGKQAAARIEALEEQLRAQETQAPKPVAAAPREKKKPTRAGRVPTEAAKTPRGRGKPVRRDPGDAVPPEVAVGEPVPMDAEARAAFESPEATLHPADS